ncbi:MAG: hypothetical protein HFH01_03780 [Dorea sp.]|nr:hypothetical protein [Dorea sp.]
MQRKGKKAGLILMSLLLVLMSLPVTAAEAGKDTDVYVQDADDQGENDQIKLPDGQDTDAEDINTEDEAVEAGESDSKKAEGADITAQDGQEKSNYDLSSDQITVRFTDAQAEHIYTGSQITPEIEVVIAGEDPAGGDALAEKVIGKGNYTVEYENNIDAGEASVIVTGKDEPGKDGSEEEDPGKDESGNEDSQEKEEDPQKKADGQGDKAGEAAAGDICTGVKTVKFRILPADITKCELNAPKSADYTGKQVKPDVKLEFEGKKLVSKKDYRLTYSNNINKGTAGIQIEGIGNFTGSRTVKFTIRFGTPAIKVTSSYSQIKLKWQKVKDASGYVLYRSTSPNSGFKKVKTYKSASQTSYSDTKAKFGKTYYYKARAYRNVRSKKKTKKEYGVWSAAVSGKKQLGTVKIASAKCASETTAKLSWGKVTGAQGYEIYKCETKNGTYTYAGKVSGGKVSYTAKKLKMGVKYYFKVKAFRKSGSKVHYGEFSAAKAETFTDGQRLYFLFPEGIPTKKAEMEQYLVTITVPIKDVNGVPSTKQLRVHKKLTKEFMDAFQDMYAVGFPVRAEDTDTYNWRSMASGKNRSHHSYGCVVDLNWSSNPMIGVTEGKYQPGVDPYSVTPEVVAIWKKHGFFWGGDWKSSKDYMHFTYTNH